MEKNDQLFLSRFKEITHGLTYREIAQKTGLATSTIGAYAIGQRSPKLEAIKAIADAFQVSFLWLAGWSEDRKMETLEIRPESLSSDQYYIIRLVLDGSPDLTKAIRSIVEQVVSLRGQ